MKIPPNRIWFMGKWEVHVTHFDGPHHAEDSSHNAWGKDGVAEVQVALKSSEDAWKTIGFMRLPWNRSWYFLELGKYPKESLIALRARTEKTAIAAALPIILGWTMATDHEQQLKEAQQ